LNAKVISSYRTLIDKCIFKHIVYVTYTILHTLCLRAHLLFSNNNFLEQFLAQLIFSNTKSAERTDVVFAEVKEVDVLSAVVVVTGVVEIVVVVVDTVDDSSSSITFSDELVLFIGSCKQHRILAVGHCTSSRTSSHINVANACTHTPGQSAIFAVLVKEFKKPVTLVQYIGSGEHKSAPWHDIVSATRKEPTVARLI